MKRPTLYIKFKILSTFFIITLALFITGCVPVTRASWEVFELLSIDNEDMRTVSESVRVSGCVIPERKSVACNAGTDNELAFVIGGGVGGGGRGAEINVSPSVEASLVVGQSDGESLELPQAKLGFIYHYQILKTYRVISGEALARSSTGQTRTASFAFHASCSVQAAGIQIEPCPSDLSGVMPNVQQSSFATPEIAPETPISLPTVTNLDLTDTPTDDSDLASLRYQLLNCTFVHNSNQMNETGPCPLTMPGTAQNIFIHAVLVNDHSEALYLSRVTAILTRIDGQQQPINNPIYTMPVKLESGEKLPLITSILPQLLKPGHDYQFQVKACFQVGPCHDTEWQYILGEPYRFYVASH